MANQQQNTSLEFQKGLFSNLKYDLPAGLVVFLVAIPLCLGIATGSKPDPGSGIDVESIGYTGAIAGLIAGIIGGLVIPWISRSELSVSGPAAGLISIVALGMVDLGSFSALLMAGVLGGVLQIIFGLVKAGRLAKFFPGSVIRGMLAAIGLTLVLKQFPHLIGHDTEVFGMEDFFLHNPEHENTFTHLLHAFSHMEKGALIIGSVCIGILVLWNRTKLKNISWLPGALVVVIVGALLNLIFGWVGFDDLYLEASHRVNIPIFGNPDKLISFPQGQKILDSVVLPDFGALANPKVYLYAVMLGLVASLESLLSVEAVDKLDPFHRETPLNRELIAQGVANLCTAAVGGLPITSVIVRSSANVNAGGRTRMAAIVHGLFLLLSVLFFSRIFNTIPSSALAAILLLVGLNLANPKLVVGIFKAGMNQFIPFAVTVFGALFTNLLYGIFMGMFVALVFVLINYFKGKRLGETLEDPLAPRASSLKEYVNEPIKVSRESGDYVIKLRSNISFFHKSKLIEVFRRIPDNKKVVVQLEGKEKVDPDIVDALRNNVSVEARRRNVKVNLEEVDKHHPKEEGGGGH